MIIATTNDLPGYDVVEVLGEVFGLTVRSRNIGSQIGAGLKSLVGGRLRGMTKMLAEGRQQAIARLVEEAEAKGASASTGCGAGCGRGSPLLLPDRATRGHPCGGRRSSAIAASWSATR